jgi:hypothetical protein
MTGFDPLASVTLSHILGDLLLLPCPPKILFQVLIHLAAARVDGKIGQVSLVKDFSPEFLVLWHYQSIFKPKHSLPISTEALVLFPPFE